MSDSFYRGRIQELARQLRDNLTGTFQERQARTEAVITSVTRDAAGRATSATATIDGVASQPVAIDHGARIAPGDTWLVRNTAGATLPHWEAERRLRAAAEAQAVDSLPTLPTPTGLQALTGLEQLVAGAAWTAYIRLSWLGIGPQYGVMDYEVNYMTNVAMVIGATTVTDRQPTILLDGAIDDSQTAIPRDADAAGYEDDFPSFGRIQIESEKVDYTTVTTGAGDSGTGTGAAGSLTDGTKSWDTNEWADYLLTDSGSNVFVIASNTDTVLTVVGTPATGAYTIKPCFSGCTRGAAGTTPAAHDDNTGVGALSVGVTLAGLLPATDYNVRVRAKSVGGALSAWTAWVSITAASDTTAPAVPTGMAYLNTGNTTMRLTWDANTETDLSHYVIETGYVPGSYTSTVALSQNWMDLVSVWRDVYWHVKAVDRVGNESAYCAEQTGVALVLADPELLNKQFEDGDTSPDHWTLDDATYVTTTWTLDAGWKMWPSDPDNYGIQVAIGAGTGDDAWFTALESDIFAIQSGVLYFPPGFYVYQSALSAPYNKLAITIYQYSDGGGTPAMEPYQRFEIDYSNEWRNPGYLGVPYYNVPGTSDVTHVSLAFEVHTLATYAQTIYLDVAQFDPEEGAREDMSHSDLTDLDADDHLQYGLIEFSETEPASPRAGMLWVVVVT